MSGPGRQRSAAADGAILGATLDLLRDRGYDALTVAAVIDRSGVSSATLYRRWPTKHELVAAAIASMASEDLDVDTGSLDGDLAAFVGHVARTLEARGNVVDLLTVGGKRDPDLSTALGEKIVAPRLRVLAAVLRRAAERGDVAGTPSPGTLLTMIVGPLYYRVSILGEPLTPAFERDVAAYALRGLTG